LVLIVVAFVGHMGVGDSAMAPVVMGAVFTALLVLPED